MIEPPSLEKKLEVVFDELEEDLSIVSSGILFIHVSDNRVAAFGVRQHTELEKGNMIIQPDRTGLTAAHQRSFRNMAIEVFRKRPEWTEGEILFPFHVQTRVLRATVRYKPFGEFHAKQD